MNRELEANGIEGFQAAIPDVDARIEELEGEIDLILHSEPYTYRELLENRAAAAEKKKALEKEIAEYEAYKKELTEKRDKIKGE